MPSTSMTSSAATAPSEPATRLITGLALPALEALRWHSERRPRRVVLPIDESTVMQEFLLHAAFLMEGSNSEIHLLLVCRPSDTHNGDELRLAADRRLRPR